MPVSLLSKSLQAVGVSAFFSVTAFTVWTKHCHFTPPQNFNPSTDPLFTSKWARKYNPRNHDTTHDECVRRIALQKIRPDLIEDAKAGGSKLVEEFVRGIWSGPGYTIQRLYLTRKYLSPSTSSTPSQLWTPAQLSSDRYEPGTQITDHFVVLAKTPNSVIVRCGDSPSKNPDSPRDSDGLFEMTAVADLEKGYAEFRLKSVFYAGDESWTGGSQGTGTGVVEKMKEAGKETVKGVKQLTGKESGNMAGMNTAEKWDNRGPMQGWMWYAHGLYTKLWMESALTRCKV